MAIFVDCHSFVIGADPFRTVALVIFIRFSRSKDEHAERYRGGLRPDRSDHAVIVAVLTFEIPQENEETDRSLDISPRPVKEYGDRIKPAAVVFPVGLHGKEQTDQKKSQKIAKSVFVIVGSA